MAKASPCPLRFAMATEGGWDVGCFAACLVAAAMLTLRAPLEVCVLLALPACVAGLALLRRCYARPTLV
jgi:MFS transporter, DHA1 family, inner membrane transport protein